MLRAVIVEDEPVGLENLTKMLEKYCPEIEIIGTADSNASFIDLIDNLEHPPDVAFLDINLPDGTVFNSLSELDDVSFEVIFVTAFNEYAIKAFEVAALDYVLKPFEPNDLIRAVGRVKISSPSANTQVADRVDIAQKFYQSGPNAFEKIGISAMDAIHLVRLRDVIRLEGSDNYTSFYLQNGEKITASKTIKVFEKMLKPINFIRTHKSHVVNLNYVKTYIKGDGGILILENEDNIPVSRRNKTSVVTVMRSIQRDL